MNHERQISLPGRIAGLKLDRTFVIYDSGKIKTQFKLRDDEISYSGLKWMYHNDSFVGIEYLQTKSGLTNRGNVVRFDIEGKIIDRIYESEEGELAGDAYPSWDDKKLLITSEKIGDRKDNPLEGLSRKQSVVIFDLERRKVIQEIENIGLSPNLQIEESPWLLDGNSFVYSLTSGRSIVNDGEIINPLEDGYAGIYIYDLVSGEKKLLVLGGRFVIASPTSNQIAYIIGKSIKVMDLNSRSEKTVYEIGSEEKVSNIHWTPDGKCIYFPYFDYYMGLSDLFTSGEKLIDVNSGEEVQFKKLKHGFHPYTWR